MNRKRIYSIINDKLCDYIKSLPQDLRKEVKESIIVTGGCITSMLLNEKINDFDIYFNNPDTIIKLLNHYKINEKCIILDGRQKDSLSENNKIDIEDKLIDKYSVAIRTLHPDQIKLFFRETGFIKNEIENIDEHVYKPLFISPNAISLTNKIQIILRFYGQPNEIHENYDFIHTTNYFTYKDGLVLRAAALESILTKTLKYQGSLYPLTSMMRIRKFLKREWIITAGEMLKIMFQLSKLNLEDPDVLEEQLMGVDVAYFDRLISLIRDNDTKNITTDWLIEKIEEVFNDDKFEEHE